MDNCFGGKASISLKTYGIIVHGVPIANIDIKSLDTSRWLIMQNADAFPNMNIRWLGWLAPLKVSKTEALLVFELDDVKTANRMINKGMVIRFGMHRCVLYNRECKIKQCFNCYQYGHISPQCRATTMCGSYSGLHKSSECVETEKQCCPVCKGKHRAWDIGCENRKKELRRVRTACEQLPTYHQIRKSLSLAQAK